MYICTLQPQLNSESIQTGPLPTAPFLQWSALPCLLPPLLPCCPHRPAPPSSALSGGTEGIGQGPAPVSSSRLRRSLSLAPEEAGSLASFPGWPLSVGLAPPVHLLLFAPQSSLSLSTGSLAPSVSSEDPELKRQTATLTTKIQTTDLALLQELK